MARLKVRTWSLVTVAVLAIALAVQFFWQEGLTPAKAYHEEVIYTVQGGDSLQLIAKEFGVSVEAIAEANGLTPDTQLYKQQQLIIPAATSEDSAGMSEEMAVVESAAPSDDEASDEGAATPTPTAEGASVVSIAEVPTAAAQAAPSSQTTYTVQAGDSLVSIAQEFDVDLDALAAANGLERNSGLYKRQVLIIPTGPAPVAQAAVPVASEGIMAQPAEEATAEPTGEVTEGATEEATAEPTEETGGAPAEETVEPTAEADEGVTEGTTAEPTEEMTVEPTAAATEEATAEATVEATAVITEGATAEPTEEITPTVAVTEEATVEATAVITEGVTAEPTEEMTPTTAATGEATAEPTGEAAEGATAESTDEVVAQPADLVDTLVSLGNFTTLVSLLEAAELTGTLKTQGPLTLFAPTDAAFAALPEGTIDAFLATPSEDLRQILLYHMLPGKILSADLSAGPDTTTLQGGVLTITSDEVGIKVNDANITISDIEATNGVIHVIDAVLLPPGGLAAVPLGTAVPTSPEAASGDAASVIIVPAPVTLTSDSNAAQLWNDPDSNIALFSPVEEGGYHSPVEVIGLAHTAEGNVEVSLIGPDGALLAQRTTLGGALDYAFFQTHVRFNVQDVTEATLNVIEMDMADGSILTEISVPVTLLPGQRVIDVTTPGVGQAACEPLLVSGYSNTFEANVVLRLTDPDGETLAEVPAMGGTLGVYRDFVTTLPYQVDEGTPVLVSVTETDASGRFPSIDQTVIPVTLYPAYNAACS
jgi:uncharacterized surface protein with fasciclin (FAS1) repeats/LysM repeat protein